jgi:hypothetical protein
MRAVRFGVMLVIGFNLIDVQIGNIVIKIMHNGLTSRVQVWVRM